MFGCCMGQAACRLHRALAVEYGLEGIGSWGVGVLVSAAQLRPFAYCQFSFSSTIHFFILLVTHDLSGEKALFSKALEAQGMPSKERLL